MIVYSKCKFKAQAKPAGSNMFLHPVKSYSGDRWHRRRSISQRILATLQLHSRKITGYLPRSWCLPLVHPPPPSLPTTAQNLTYSSRWQPPQCPRNDLQLPAKPMNAIRHPQSAGHLGRQIRAASLTWVCLGMMLHPRQLGSLAAPSTASRIMQNKRKRKVKMTYLACLELHPLLPL